MAVIFSFAIIIVLILVNGLFVAAEFAIIGVRPTRIKQLAMEGNRAARWVQGILDDRRRTDRYIATAQLGITLASLGLGMYAEPAIAHLIEQPLYDWFGLEGKIIHTIGFIFALALITYLHVVIGEMIPKSLALQKAERAVLSLSLPMNIAGKFFSLPVTVLNRIGLWTLKLLRIPVAGENSRLYSLDELEILFSESFLQGKVDASSQVLVNNFLDFTVERVDEVMVPRPRITAIPDTISEDALVDFFTSTPYNRLPVYHDTIDNIIGMLHLKDLVRQQLSEQPFDLNLLIRQVTFVPESLPAKTLLADFQRKKQQIAIVFDEHGGTLGLVTLEDLLEEVVGEVRDEFDVGEKEALKLVAPGHLTALGTVSLEDIYEYIHINEFDSDVHTVGGLVWAKLGHLPEVGDEIKIGKVIVRVDVMSGLTVVQVSIHFPAHID